MSDTNTTEARRHGDGKAGLHPEALAALDALAERWAGRAAECLKASRRAQEIDDWKRLNRDARMMSEFADELRAVLITLEANNLNR